MRIIVRPSVIGGHPRQFDDPFKGRPIEHISVDVSVEPQIGDRLPALVPGHGPLTVQSREHVASGGASLTLAVDATCREVTP